MDGDEPEAMDLFPCVCYISIVTNSIQRSWTSVNRESPQICLGLTLKTLCSMIRQT